MGVKENLLEVEGIGQGAKIRKDKTSGYIMTSTAWAELGGQEVNHVALVKLSSSLDVEWSKLYGMAGGHSQVFDILVDREGNYLLGGSGDEYEYSAVNSTSGWDSDTWVSYLIVLD